MSSLKCLNKYYAYFWLVSGHKEKREGEEEREKRVSI